MKKGFFLIFSFLLSHFFNMMVNLTSGKSNLVIPSIKKLVIITKVIFKSKLKQRTKVL